MSFPGLPFLGLIASSQLYMQASAKRADIATAADTFEKDHIWEEGCCKWGCKMGRTEVPFCASRVALWDVVHEGRRLEVLDDSVCRSVSNGRACDTRQLPESKFGFDTGSYVVWTEASDEGTTIGQVVGFAGNRVEVRFIHSGRIVKIDPTELVKAESPEVPTDGDEMFDAVNFFARQPAAPAPPPNPVETLAWMLTQEQHAPGEDPTAVLAWWLSKTESKYKLLGNGWCRPAGCSDEDPSCRVTGFWKGKSSHAECAAMCDASEDCTGFSISSSNYKAGVSETCMVHGSNPPSGWQLYKQKYHDVSRASGMKEVQCYKRQ